MAVKHSLHHHTSTTPCNHGYCHWSWLACWLLVAGMGLLSSCHSSHDLTTPPAESRGDTISEAQLQLDGMLLQAKAYQLTGNTEQAATAYRNLLRKEAHYGAANYGMAQLLSISQPDSAIVYIERAIDDEPENTWYRLWATKLYQLVGDTRRLSAMWESIVAQHPTTLDYYYELSDSYVAGNNLNKAIEVLNRVERWVGVTEIVSLQKQRLWNELKQPDKATAELERLVQALPGERKYTAMLAESYMEQKKYNKAKVCYDRMLAADPDDEYIHVQLSQYYRAVGKPEQAFTELQQAFANPKLPASTKVQLLTRLYSEEDFYGKDSVQALALLKQVMESGEDMSQYALFYANALMQQQRWAEALPWLRLHLSHDSSRYEPWEALLVCEANTADSIVTPDSILLRDAERVSRKFPLHPLAYYLQATLYEQREQYAEALQQLSRCEQLISNNDYLAAMVYELMALCYHQQGAMQQCFAYFDKLLLLQPDNVWTLNNYAYYLAEADQDLERAEDMAARAAKARPHDATILDTYAWVLFKRGKVTEARKVIKQAVPDPDKTSATLREHYNTIINQ